MILQICQKRDTEAITKCNQTVTIKCKSIDWQQIDIELIKTFKKLNEDGKAVAIERVEELTEIPRYTQKESNMPDKQE